MNLLWMMKIIISGNILKQIVLIDSFTISTHLFASMRMHRVLPRLWVFEAICM